MRPVSLVAGPRMVGSTVLSVGTARAVSGSCLITTVPSEDGSGTGLMSRSPVATAAFAALRLIPMSGIGPANVAATALPGVTG
jgi:hypothetical protein